MKIDVEANKKKSQKNYLNVTLDVKQKREKEFLGWKYKNEF